MQGEQQAALDEALNVGQESDSLLDSDTLLSKTLLVKHVVRLVEHKHLDSTRIDALGLDQVERLSGCAHNQLGSNLVSTLDLVRQRELRGHISELGHGLDHLHDLTGKLARCCKKSKWTGSETRTSLNKRENPSQCYSRARTIA